MSTYKPRHDLREALCTVPLDRLLIETDAPYLTPEPYRRERCEPGHTLITVDRLAVVRREDPGVVRRAVTANAERLFGAWRSAA
jgi:TatD DNase family protein